MLYIAWGHCHCKNYSAVIKTWVYSENGQTFKMVRFAKRMMRECRQAARNFSGQEKFRETRAF